MHLSAGLLNSQGQQRSRAGGLTLKPRMMSLFSRNTTLRSSSSCAQGAGQLAARSSSAAPGEQRRRARWMPCSPSASAWPFTAASQAFLSTCLSSCSRRALPVTLLPAKLQTCQRQTRCTGPCAAACRRPQARLELKGKRARLVLSLGQRQVDQLPELLAAEQEPSCAHGTPSATGRRALAEAAPCPALECVQRHCAASALPGFVTDRHGQR